MSTALTPALAPRFVGAAGGPALQLLSTAMPSASSSHAQPSFLAAPIAATVEPVSDPVFDQTYLPYNWNSFLDENWLKLIVLFIMAYRLTNTVFGMPLGGVPRPPRGPDDTPVARLADQQSELKKGGGAGDTGAAEGGEDDTGPTGDGE